MLIVWASQQWAHSPAPPPTDEALLMESGDFLLLEDGSDILLE